MATPNGRAVAAVRAPVLRRSCRALQCRTGTLRLQAPGRLEVVDPESGRRRSRGARASCGALSMKPREPPSCSLTRAAVRSRSSLPELPPPDPASSSGVGCSPFATRDCTQQRPKPRVPSRSRRASLDRDDPQLPEQLPPISAPRSATRPRPGRSPGCAAQSSRIQCLSCVFRSPWSCCRRGPRDRPCRTGRSPGCSSVRDRRAASETRADHVAHLRERGDLALEVHGEIQARDRRLRSARPLSASLRLCP